MSEEGTETTIHCRHCGKPIVLPPGVPEEADVLCKSCGLYQDAMICPTCGQQARISLMPAEHQPPRHAPEG